MKKINRKINMIKRKSIGPHILFFFIALLVGLALSTGSVVFLTNVITEVRHFDVLDTVYEVRDQIRTDMERGRSEEEALVRLETGSSTALDITITDPTRHILSSIGDKIDFTKAVISNEDFDVTVNIFDKNVGNDGIYVNIFNLLGRFTEGENSARAMSEVMDRDVQMISYWVEMPLGVHDDRMFMRVSPAFTGSDCIFILVVSSLVGILFGLFVLVSFIRTIINVVGQKFLIRIMLRDSVTLGHNFLSFQSTVTRILSSFFKRKNGYVLVDFSLLKFPSYCSLYGSSEGDKLLYVIDKYLKSCLNNGEVHGRVANSDFILLIKLPEYDGQEKVDVRLKEMVAGFADAIRTIPCRDKSHVIGLKNVIIKVGAYIIPDTSTPEWKERRKKKNLDISQIYSKAGIAKKMLADDESVKFYNHEMLEEEMWEQKVEDKMQEALEREEFSVYIQPKYEPSTKTLSGGEALVRWISPEDGFISPGRFIPIFEKTGFITKLDDYMISHTARLQSEWLAAGKKIVPVSVNVSRAHFAQPDLAEHIRDLVDEYPLPHNYIEIELTESAFFDDKEALLTTVRKLQEYGFEVSMDDFGAGYSSLNSLKDLPLNVLKLDAEFFRGEDSSERGEIVVSEAISLAKQLNMRVVAEGVEKKEQVDFLAQKKCDMIQGFYFDKPLPVDVYVTRFEQETVSAPFTGLGTTGLDN